MRRPIARSSPAPTGAWRRLPGSRGSNLAAVLHDVGRQWQAYIAPRALALFGMLDTNTRYLGSGAMPPDGANILDADGVVYRAFAGHGLQFHPLANFARLNRLLADGNDPDAAYLAAALISRAVPRKGALTWEYYFPFGGGYPPWTSGMVQAVAARAFAADADYDVARKAYLALPRYIFPLAGGAWIRLYSFSNMPVLNAQLQSILSLADYAQLNQDPGAAQLSERLLQTADTLFDDFDTGAWSLYSLGGAESPLNYHVFDTNLLKRIATQTQSPAWTARATRFDRYLTAPPGLSAAGPKKPVKKRCPDLDLGVEDLARQRDDRRLDFLDDVFARLAHVLLVGAGTGRGPLLGARRPPPIWPGTRRPWPSR